MDERYAAYTTPRPGVSGFVQIRMTTELFRLAVVGAGLISSSSHVPSILSNRKAVLAALVDPVLPRAEGITRTYGIEPVVAQNIEAVLDRIDGAVIATPNESHKDIAVACLNAGVSVLVEKPLAVNSAEGQAITEAARRNNRVAAVGYVTRFRESTVLLKRILDRQYFGSVRRFVHQFGTTGGWSPASAYNLSRRATGGGVLVVTGTHFLDRMLHFWGMPSNVAYEDDSQGGPEANCQAYFQYETTTGSFQGSAAYSKTTSLPGGMVIETEEGYLILSDSDDAELRFVPNDASGLEHVIRSGPERPFPAGMSAFELQIDDFIDACREGRPPMVDSEQATLSLRLIESLYARRSAISDDLAMCHGR